MTTTSGVRNHVEHCSIAPKAFKDWFRGLVDGLADTPPSADQWAMVRAKIEALEESPPKFMTAQESAMRALQGQVIGGARPTPAVPMPGLSVADAGAHAQKLRDAYYVATHGHVNDGLRQADQHRG